MTTNTNFKLYKKTFIGLIATLLLTASILIFLLSNYTNYISLSSTKIYTNNENAILYCIDDKNTILENKSTDKIYPASTTKLLTALTVLKYCNENEKVKIGDEITYVHPDSSTAHLEKGQKLTVKQLLEGLLLPSGNDAAYSLAAYVGYKQCKATSLDNAISCFVDLMNKTAKELGATNSKFLNPDGYDKNGVYTTVKDLLLIASAALNSNTINYICSLPSLRETFSDGTDITWENSNELINPSSKYYYKNALGLKTGSTDLAGKCLISAAKINGKTYLSVVMNSTEEGRWVTSINQFNYAKNL